MEERQIAHKRAEGHRTAVATGILVSGLLPDGNVPVVFFRDTVEVLGENFFIQTISHAGFSGQQMTPNQTKPAEVRQVREDVATILVPVDKLESFAAVLRQVADSLSAIRSATATYEAAAQASE